MRLPNVILSVSMAVPISHPMFPVHINPLPMFISVQPSLIML